MNSEILADLKRLKDDIETLRDIAYGAHRSCRNNEDMSFPIKSLHIKLITINDIYKRIEENWKRENP